MASYNGTFNLNTANYGAYFLRKKSFGYLGAFDLNIGNYGVYFLREESFEYLGYFTAASNSIPPYGQLFP